MATGDLTTLENAKLWLNIDSSNANSDVLLSRLITAASKLLIVWLDRNSLLSASYSDVLDGNGHDGLHLKNWPITAVSSVTVNGIVVSLSTDGRTNGYVFDDKFLYILPATNVGHFQKGIRNVLVSYTAGYAEVPFDVEQACIELVALRYRERDRIGKKSESLNGQQTVSYSTRDLGDDIRKMLKNYRGVVPL